LVPIRYPWKRFAHREREPERGDSFRASDLLIGTFKPHQYLVNREYKSQFWQQESILDGHHYAAGAAGGVDAALDAGINLFDTADIYGAKQSEEFLGKALKRRRHQAIIATKFGMKLGEAQGGADPTYIRKSIDASLRRLQVDAIDLYQIHYPDPNTPI